jgi:hypothetical protein
MSQVEQVVERLGQIVITLQTQVERHEETIKSLSKWLTHAFREMGYDFEKIAVIESSRRRDEVQADVNAILNPEEMDPAVQDEIAKKILTDMTLEQGPRALVTEASNKGRKE